MNYYNEFDPFAAQWLRELIKDGLIPDGYVDDRSILEVTADDLKGYTQHHFFAGIAGWSRALQLAGWPATRPVCTASLPCQPFSVAGQQLGKDDERHLLPHFMQLVRDFQFDTIMGEQVEGAVRHGWLDDLHTEMEAEGYTTGAVVLGAHSIGYAHRRQRIYWIADSNSKGREGLEQRANIGKPGQRRRVSKEDLLPIWRTPHERTDMWPQPIIRSGVDGVSNRVGILRGAGNAIVPTVAAEVIKAYMETT